MHFVHFTSARMETLEEIVSWVWKACTGKLEECVWSVLASVCPERSEENDFSRHSMRLLREEIRGI